MLFNKVKKSMCLYLYYCFNAYNDIVNNIVLGSLALLIYVIIINEIRVGYNFLCL